MKPLMLALVLIVVAGCSSSERARMNPLAYSKRYTVTLYSGGSAVKTWTAKGKVQSEEESDGYYFVDQATDHLIDVSGTVVIEAE